MITGGRKWAGNAWGQDICTQVSQPNGHYNHLDVISLVRGSLSATTIVTNVQDVIAIVAKGIGAME